MLIFNKMCRKKINRKGIIKMLAQDQNKCTSSFILFENLFAMNNNNKILFFSRNV